VPAIGQDNALNSQGVKLPPAFPKFAAAQLRCKERLNWGHEVTSKALIRVSDT